MNTTVVTITGNVVNAPEVRTTQHGVPFASFRLAQNERRRLPSGDYEDQGTNYFQVTAFRALGLNVAESVRKGEPVVVQGRLRVNQFLRGDGSPGTSVEIDAYAVGHNLALGTTVLTRTAGLRQADSSDRLADPHVQASIHGDEAMTGPEQDVEDETDSPAYEVVDGFSMDPRTGEVEPERGPEREPETVGV